MIPNEFDHIVSLGGHCQTAYQIRRYFGVDSAHLFDWLVTPTASLIHMVEDEFGHLFSDLRIVNEPSGAKAVMDFHYGLMHYHDFDAAFINGVPNPLLIRKEIPRNISKFSYLLEKLMNLEGDVLFVRHQHGVNINNIYENIDLSDELMDRLVASIRKISPKAEPYFLLLNGPSYFESKHSNVHIDSVDNRGLETWDGSADGWNELFERLGIKLKAGHLSITETDSPTAQIDVPRLYEGRPILSVTPSDEEQMSKIDIVTDKISENLKSRPRVSARVNY